MRGRDWSSETPVKTRRLTTGPRVLLALLLVAEMAVPPSVALAQETVEPSDVVIVLDYSLSILQDEASRGQFAEALARIADSVDEKAADLAAGNATISFVAFASTAVDYLPECVDLKLSGSEENVHQLATCFRRVWGEYKAGPDAPVRERVGNATNYVAAFERAALHLPAASRRPAIVFFTDGKHETQGVPPAAVQPAADSLFGARSPFAFLPVGMGLVPDERSQLESGLLALRDLTRDMHPCPGGATFEWPTVVFDTAEAAGEAVSVAVQRVTCGFPALVPTPGPTTGPTAPPAVTAAPSAAATLGPPAAPLGVSVESGDGAATVRVAPAPDGASAAGYTVECSTDGGSTWLPAPTAQAAGDAIRLGGLVNASEYRCRVYAENAHGLSAASPVSNPFTPCGSLFECQPSLLSVIVAVIGGALLALMTGVIVWSQNRRRRHITVELDGLGRTYLGRGPSVGASLMRDGSGRLRGLMPGDRRSEIVVRHRGGDRFTITAARKSTDVLAGEPATMVDDRGETHRLVLRHWGATGYDFEPSGPEARRRP
ncbi:MAG TPA: hypothetical protein VEX41_03610 [Candidatus Eisenbacteria bacterium]|nr:hypothetical protein [Candidatus Eisenbacteria bacterium]